MKNSTFAVLACAMILGLILFAYVSSCITLSVSELPEMPWGVWESIEDEPKFTFTIDPEDKTYRYPGTYAVDGETIEILLSFTGYSRQFKVYPTEAVDPETNVLYGDMNLFSCSFQLEGDTMTCQFYPKGDDAMQEYTFMKISEFEEHKPL